MSIFGAIGAGVAQAGQNLADESMVRIKAEVDAQKQERLAELQGQIAVQTHATNALNDANMVSQQRATQVATVAAGAQQLAQARANKSNGIISGQMDDLNSNIADSNAGTGYQFSDDQLSTLDASKASLEASKVQPTVTHSDILESGVNSGYEKALDLVKMDRERDTARAAELANQIKQTHEENIAAKTDAQAEAANRKLDLLFEKLSKTGDAGTAVLTNARAIQADEATRGNNISIATAIGLTHKADDGVNGYAMKFATGLAEARQIGADPDDPTKAAPGKLYPSFLDALAAGRADYVTNGAAGQPGTKQPAPALPPLQDVTVGGKVIGQARTPAEAAALVAKNKKGG